MKDADRACRRGLAAILVLSSAAGALALGAAATAGVIRVDADAPVGGNGASWATAFKSLQAGIDAAAASPGADELWIAEGTYIPEKEGEAGTPKSRRFTLTGDVTLLGGFAGTELSASERDPFAHPTVLSGDVLKNDTGQPSSLSDNVANIVVLSGAGARTIDGVTIRAAAGDASGFVGVVGHGISILNGTLTLKRSIVRDNRGHEGGGIALLTNTALVVEDCQVIRNIGVNNGGGLYLASGGSAMVRNCSFISNEAGQAASALQGGGAWVTLLDCTFERNASGTNNAAVTAQAPSANQPTVMVGCTFRRNVNGAASLVGTSLVTECLFEQNLGSTVLSVGGTNAQTAVTASVFRDNRSGLVVGGAGSMVSGCLFEWNRRDFDGAAIYGTATALSVSNCLFQYNRANGSTVYSECATTTIEHCEFRGNVGGGLRLANQAGTAHLSDCLFVGNSSVAANAVLRANCQYLLAEDSAFVGNGNTETGYIFLAVGKGDVRRCLFQDNSMGQGGAMTLAANQLQDGMHVANCRFVGNRAPANVPVSGGAILVMQGVHTLQNCLFSGNTSRGSGGAIAISGIASLAVEQCALMENDSGLTGTSPGGGIFVDAGSCAIRNSIIWGSGAGAFTSQLSGPVASITVDGCIVQGWNGSFAGVGNSAANPLFVGVAGPDGLLGTEDDSADVLPGSPAIGGGLPSVLGADLADLDGDGNLVELLPLDLFDQPRVVGTVDRGPIEH